MIDRSVYPITINRTNWILSIRLRIDWLIVSRSIDRLIPSQSNEIVRFDSRIMDRSVDPMKIYRITSLRSTNLGLDLFVYLQLVVVLFDFENG